MQRTGCPRKERKEVVLVILKKAYENYYIIDKMEQT